MKVLVTGGGGALGLAICRILKARGHAVRSVSRGVHPALDALGVEAQRGDLSQRSAADAAVADCEAVMHVAGRTGSFGPDHLYRPANLDSTLHLLDACADAGISRFVYTSTPSVVHGGGDVAGADETVPYPDHYETAYQRTKAAAERAVLARNGQGIATVALRPHLVWGAGDTNLTQRVVARARAGRLRFVGDGTNKVDGCYLDNAAEAHVLAVEAIQAGAACAGRAYFLTNDEPMATRDLVNGIVTAAGLPPVTRMVSPGLARFLGGALELGWTVLGRTDE
ncbi:MAG: NAD-dependent epimerase/dehydratase family protein, partial [Myxococcota bacterium]|nr:NAD-dependent epimerase/dehydratase family protein [Myxococcota bacterium]